jgi:hypothetical protein
MEELLRDRFGDEGVACMADIDKIASQEKLRTILRTIAASTSLDDAKRSWLS